MLPWEYSTYSLWFYILAAHRLSLGHEKMGLNEYRTKSEVKKIYERTAFNAALLSALNSTFCPPAFIRIAHFQSCLRTWDLYL
jgi:hypothetical protein